MKTELPARVVTGAALVAGLFAMATLSIAIGARNVAVGEIWRALVDYAGTDDHIVVRDVRIPRTLLGMCVGAALGAAGTLIQVMTRNPLAEPGLLGVNAGAGFAVNVGVLLGLAGTQGSVLVLAIVGSAIASVAVYAVGRTAPLRLLLAGMTLTWVLSGLSLGMRLMYPDVFDQFRFWTVGSLAGREQTPLLLPAVVIVVALVGALLLSVPLSALSLGENVAHTLGVNVAKARLALLIVVTVLAGAATAIAGPIAFIGLMVPHIARRLARGSVSWLVGYAMVLGPILLLLSDIASRVLLPTGEVPVGVVTAFIGGPVLIWVVRRYGAVAV